LTFSQTLKLKLETSLISSNYTLNYVTLTALENHNFFLFGPYSAIIRLNSGQSAESLNFGQTSQLGPETG